MIQGIDEGKNDPNTNDDVDEVKTFPASVLEQNHQNLWSLK